MCFSDAVACYLVSCAYLVQLLHQIGVLIGNVLLDEGRSLEQFLTGLATELALILLLDELFTRSRQFSANV